LNEVTLILVLIKSLSNPFTEMWDDEDPAAAEPLSAADLAGLQGCREFGRVLRVSRKMKIVEVEVNTLNKAHTLQYDLTKFGMDFVPWTGKTY
jgi:hypothetical protein